jgi:phosphate starvation-inducible PhoH-like protein
MPIKQKTSEYNTTNKKSLIKEIIGKTTRKKFLSENQKTYYEQLTKNEITICSGPAGVGKSFIAMRAAIDLLLDETNSYEKIIIVRPAVEAEEKLGSLPGNLEEKLDPYIFPSYYLLNKIIGKESRLIFEESQNSTPSQMKLLLTRIGFNSKFFISGDVEQTDRYRDKTHSGLYDALKRFRDIDGVGVFEFENEDIIRNPLIGKLLQRYEQ